jgi:putative nucleotidyltransferase with HDIG domain
MSRKSVNLTVNPTPNTGFPQRKSASKAGWSLEKASLLLRWVLLLSITVTLVIFLFEYPQVRQNFAFNHIILIFPLLVMLNSIASPWYSGLGSAIIVNIILTVLFLSGKITGYWSIFFLICVLNMAIGSITLLLKQRAISDNTGETMNKELEFGRIQRELQAESQHRLAAEKELLETTRKLTTVIQVTRALGTLDNLGNLFETIVEKAREEMDSQIAFLMLEKDRKLEVEYSVGVSEKTKRILACEIIPGKNPIAEVIFNSTPLRIESTELKSFEIFRKAQENIKNLLVVPMSVPDENQALGVLGVANFMPGEEYTDEHEDFLNILAVEAAMFIRQLKLKQDLEKSYFDLISALAQAIEAKDSYTRDHVHRVADYAKRLAQAFRLTNDEIKRIEKAAILHDIGKITTPESILNKKGSLTDEEKKLMKKHVVESRKMLSKITLGIDEKVKDYVEYHHERWDGKGYPKGLKGKEIPLGAQIIAVADTFDAMTSNRAYRKGFVAEEALIRMMNTAGTQFNPEVLHVFFEMMSFDVNTGKIRPDLNDTLECQVMEKRFS